MKHCLCADELNMLLGYVLDGVPVADAPLGKMAQWAEDWNDELLSLSYTFAKVLSRQEYVGDRQLRACEVFFSLGDRMWFTVEEVGVTFVEYLLRNIRDDELTLEEELIRIHSNMSRFQYETTVRM